MTDQVKFRKRLEALLKLPENQVCADCGKRGGHINNESWSLSLRYIFRYLFLQVHVGRRLILEYLCVLSVLEFIEIWEYILVLCAP